MEPDAYIQNFLDSTLKSFSEEELKLILHELRKRRSDLFEEGGRSYSLEMKEMLGNIPASMYSVKRTVENGILSYQLAMRTSELLYG